MKTVNLVPVQHKTINIQDLKSNMLFGIETNDGIRFMVVSDSESGRYHTINSNGRVVDEEYCNLTIIMLVELAIGNNEKLLQFNDFFELMRWMMVVEL